MKTFEEISDLYDRHCVTGYRYTYGTAGFRHNADILDTVLFSTGVLACMRSIYLKGRFVGAMITASHNPPEDNGVKLVDPQGNMLDQDWEACATDMANTASKGKDAFFKKVEQLLKELNIQESDIEASIALACDSRESGPRLKNAFIDGTKVFQNVKLVDFGMLTTPQLHFLTEACNSGAAIEQIKEEMYYSHFVSAWEELSKLHGIKSAPYPMVLDAANGVGGIKAELLFRQIPFFRDAVTIINGQWSDYKLLNKACGADFVKTNQCLPENIPEDSPLETLYCSFDGDADRVIFYYRDASKWFHLLDGDKLSTLLAKFFQQLLPVAGIQHSVKLGVVQTAYANGSSAKYLSEVLRVPVSCTPTGVKHLHREAVNNYDIGIYFEANGHGTVVFSDNFKILVNSRLEKTNLDKDAAMALRTLKLFTRLINQTIGDAISDMMSVLFVLCVLKWSPQDWDREYRDLPNTLLKVVVPNRAIFKTTNAEQQLISPEGLQDQIDEVVKSYDNARVFVRASGTEDAVRIYAEAATKDQANTLSGVISELVVKATAPR